VQKGVAFGGSQGEMVRQQLGHGPGRLTFIDFDLLNGGERTAYALSQLVLREGEHLAPLLDPSP
jgi:hypothetical protein